MEVLTVAMFSLLALAALCGVVSAGVKLYTRVKKLKNMGALKASDEVPARSVRSCYGIIFSVYTLIVAALFMWQLFTVFSSESGAVMERRPFTREIVLNALSKIDLYFWLWVAGIVVGFVLWEVFPVSEKRKKISNELQYMRLKRKIPRSAPDGLEAEYDRVMQTQKLVKGFNIAGIELFIIAAVWAVVYLSIPANFPAENVTLEILAMVKLVFPVFFAALIVMCAGSYIKDMNVKAALGDLKKVTRGVKADSAECGFVAHISAVWDNKRVVLAVRIVLAVAAVGLIVWGCLNGSARSVFIKAINICTECIGLG